MVERNISMQNLTLKFNSLKASLFSIVSLQNIYSYEKKYKAMKDSFDVTKNIT